MAAQATAPAPVTAADAQSSASALTRARLQVQRERVHTTMLIELLVLLVFLAMAFAFVRDSELRADKVQDQIRELKAQLTERDKRIRELDIENRMLRQANKELGDSYRRLLKDPTTTLRANADIVTIPRATLTQMTNDLAEKKGILDGKQRELAAANRKLAADGRGGKDLPNCTVAAGAFLIRIDALGGGGYRVSPAWQATAQARAMEVPGLAELASGRALSEAEFRRHAAQVRAWGEAQPTPCGFRAQAVSAHGSLGLYQRQFRTMQQFFYMKW